MRQLKGKTVREKKKLEKRVDEIWRADRNIVTTGGSNLIGALRRQ